MEKALARHGSPEVFNTDRGKPVREGAFTGLLRDNGIAISMDGKGSWKDNVFVERLWKSVKCPAPPAPSSKVYLKAYETVSEARRSIGEYLEFFNCQRPHSSFGRMTPDQFCQAALSRQKAA